MTDAFCGLGVALVTPFQPDGTPDTAALGRLVEYLIAGGVDYLVPLGTTGESVTLTEAEQLTVLETVFSVNNGRKPVLVGAGGNDTAKIVKTIKTFAAAFPVDGFMSVSPYYNKPSQTGIYHHYLTVASATDRPLVLYNVPPRTGSNVCADTTLRLAHDVPHIVAVKEASGSLEQIGVIVRDRPAGFRVLCGDDSIALPSIAIGCDGLVSVLGNGLPHAVSQLVGAALSGQLAEARAWHLRLLSAIELIFAEGNPTGIKALVELVGIGSRSVRQPLWPASDALVEQLRALLPLATLPQAA